MSVITLGSSCLGKALTAKDFVQEPLIFTYGKDDALSLTLENKLKIEGFYSKNMRELNDMNNAGPTVSPLADTNGFDNNPVRNKALMNLLAGCWNFILINLIIKTISGHQRWQTGARTNEKPDDRTFEAARLL